MNWDILLCSRTQGDYPVPMGLPFPILTVKVHLVEIDSAWSYKATRMIKRFFFCLRMIKRLIALRFYIKLRCFRIFFFRYLFGILISFFIYLFCLNLVPRTVIL